MKFCTYNDHLGGMARDGNSNLHFNFVQVQVSYVHFLFNFDRGNGCYIAQRPHDSVGHGVPGGSRVAKIITPGTRVGQMAGVTHGVTCDESMESGMANSLRRT